MLIVGRNPVIEALKFNPGSIRKIFILNNLTDIKLNEITKLDKKNSIIVEKVSKQSLESILSKKDKSQGISQGVAAEAEEFAYASYSDVLDKLKNKEKSVIVLVDEIQDPHNLWAIIRTSAAAGADALFITEKNSVKVNHTVIKTSSGAVNYIDILLVDSIYDTMTDLNNAGFEIIGTSLKADKLYTDYKYSNKTAVIFGNEGEGLRKNVEKMCDILVRYL